MQERHQNKRQYFEEQARTTENYVLPYIEQSMPVTAATRVLEIGCGEGGNLVPFLRRGCAAVGVDLNQTKIDLGLSYLQDVVPEANVDLIVQDIYASDAARLGTFDLIILRDVIEHIHDQERFLRFVHNFLRPEGRIFFGFPPWRMPFGGHQQICGSKALNKLPWFHLLPAPWYRKVLSGFGEPESRIEALLEIKETGISIDQFSALVSKTGFRFEQKDLWLINPNYETKFGLTPRKVPSFIDRIPWVKDFFITCCYALIRKA